MTIYTDNDKFYENILKELKDGFKIAENLMAYIMEEYMQEKRRLFISFSGG